MALFKTWTRNPANSHQANCIRQTKSLIPMTNHELDHSSSGTPARGECGQDAAKGRGIVQDTVEGLSANGFSRLEVEAGEPIGTAKDHFKARRGQLVSVLMSLSRGGSLRGSWKVSKRPRSISAVESKSTGQIDSTDIIDSIIKNLADGKTGETRLRVSPIALNLLAQVM